MVSTNLAPSIRKSNPVPIFLELGKNHDFWTLSNFETQLFLLDFFLNRAFLVNNLNIINYTIAINLIFSFFRP